eukprot:PITA_00898
MDYRSIDNRCLLNLVNIAMLMVAVSSALVIVTNANGLKVGYYRDRCPEAEAIVGAAVAKAVTANPGVAPALIRMHFHDCFVRGCDGSILIDSTAGNQAEKESPANNPSLHGFEIIDEAKSILEDKCPNVVSCADILAFAARDSAHQAGGLIWEVPAGRRDGRISRASDIPGNIPAPQFNVNQLTQNFAAKFLSVEDMVTLSGAHSIGVSHCSSFSANRLYNFSGTGHQDPSMDPRFALSLKAKCPIPTSNSNSDPTVHLDSLTPRRLDEKYYIDLQVKRGVLTSDQTLMSTPSTVRMVKINSKYPSIWRKKFGRAMVKMGQIGVLTGSQGEIRKNCRIVN